MMEYYELESEVMVIGGLAGIVASLWKVLPLLVSTLGNFWYGTVAIGALLVGLLLPENRVKGFGIATGTFLIFSFLLFPLLLGGVADANMDGREKIQNAETVTLRVPDMFCQGCVLTVSNALEGMNGVYRANVSLRTKEAVVYYNPKKTSPEAIVNNRVVQGYGGEVKNT